MHLGTCIGKLTHSGKFRLTVGALDVLAQHAKYKVHPRMVPPCPGYGYLICFREVCCLSCLLLFFKA